ncbi:hypothetical protein PHLCEN_2v87 [Hermanssonia centrifuga]|uniref:Uncharacterized protein n=1 Tax=Hermanssonia centrifuga TaxID=98765 RepID=A0A2R6S707_9APHY|nr:hypothetical protein PHLCEN_2v87 [Hermanssonia centrifuga]
MLLQDDLDHALSGKLDFTGFIAFSKAYVDAPNPGLQLAGLGPIRLPLNAREAEVINSQAKQAPFGMGERTVVDTSVRDTWEMDASSVSFQNPNWNAFITTVIGAVCQTLGVSMATSIPRCELYKLLLYETGSHFLPHVE